MLLACILIILFPLLLPSRHLTKELPIFYCEECPEDSDKPFWCDSLAFLIIITAIVWACIVYGYVSEGGRSWSRRSEGGQGLEQQLRRRAGV